MQKYVLREIATHVIMHHRNTNMRVAIMTNFDIDRAFNIAIKHIDILSIASHDELHEIAIYNANVASRASMAANETRSNKRCDKLNDVVRFHARVCERARLMIRVHG